MDELYFEVLGEAIAAFLLVARKLKEIVEEVNKDRSCENAFPFFDDETDFSNIALQEAFNQVLIDLGIEKEQVREEMERV